MAFLMFLDSLVKHAKFVNVYFILENWNLKIFFNSVSKLWKFYRLTGSESFSKLKSLWQKNCRVKKKVSQTSWPNIFFSKIYPAKNLTLFKISYWSISIKNIFIVNLIIKNLKKNFSSSWKLFSGPVYQKLYKSGPKLLTF